MDTHGDAVVCLDAPRTLHSVHSFLCAQTRFRCLPETGKCFVYNVLAGTNWGSAGILFARGLLHLEFKCGFILGIRKMID